MEECEHRETVRFYGIGIHATGRLARVPKINYPTRR